MGMRADMRIRTDTHTVRRDSLQRQKLIKQARSIIYDDCRAVSNPEVEKLLRSKSLVPVEVGFFKYNLTPVTLKILYFM